MQPSLPLRFLIQVRWVAVVGQIVLMAVVAVAFPIDLPLMSLLAAGAAHELSTPLGTIEPLTMAVP